MAKTIIEQFNDLKTKHPEDKEIEVLRKELEQEREKVARIAELIK